MIKIVIIKFLLLGICLNLNAQLFQKKYLSLRRSNIYQDTSSQFYIQKYKDIPNLFVQIQGNYEYEDLNIFQNATLIKNLSIHSNSVTSLAGLEYLHNLESLYITKCLVQDFSILKNIRSLKKLSLDSKVKIDFPLEYSLLQELNYSCNYDIGNCKFPNLEDITIHQTIAFDYNQYENQYEDYENYGLKYSLEKPCCPLNLSKLKKLNTINIYDLQIESIEEITFPERIKNIQIKNCSQLKNINGLENLKYLESLSIAYCNNIESFKILTKLKNVNWKIKYMGKVFQNEEIDILLNHPDNFYYYANDTDEHAEEKFYNFHSSVVEKSKTIFSKYHQIIVSRELSRKEFIDLISPMISELNQLCTEETCNIEWNDEESYYLIQFLNDMAQLAGYEFNESHFYARFEQ